MAAARQTISFYEARHGDRQRLLGGAAGAAGDQELARRLEAAEEGWRTATAEADRVKQLLSSRTQEASSVLRQLRTARVSGGARPYSVTPRPQPPPQFGGGDVGDEGDTVEIGDDADHADAVELRPRFGPTSAFAFAGLTPGLPRATNDAQPQPARTSLDVDQMLAEASAATSPLDVYTGLAGGFYSAPPGGEETAATGEESGGADVEPATALRLFEQEAPASARASGQVRSPLPLSFSLSLTWPLPLPFFASATRALAMWF